MRRLLRAVLAWSAILVASAGAQAPAAPDVSKLGPQVGTIVPPFAGVDQSGRAQNLESLMGPKGLMLVFNRSADW